MHPISTAPNSLAQLLDLYSAATVGTANNLHTYRLTLLAYCMGKQFGAVQDVGPRRRVPRDSMKYSHNILLTRFVIY